MPEWGDLSHDPHLVPADLAVSDRQLDASPALVGELARLLPPVDLEDLGSDLTIAQVDDLADLKLDIEVLWREPPNQVLLHIVDPMERPLGSHPFHILCDEWN